MQLEHRFEHLFEGEEFAELVSKDRAPRANKRCLSRYEIWTSDDARIDACTDLAALERWLDRAVTAASVSDVLG